MSWDVVEGSPPVDGCQCPLEIRYQHRNVGAQKTPPHWAGFRLVFVVLVNLDIHPAFESVMERSVLSPNHSAHCEHAWFALSCRVKPWLHLDGRNPRVARFTFKCPSLQVQHAISFARRSLVFLGVPIQNFKVAKIVGDIGTNAFVAVVEPQKYVVARSFDVVHQFARLHNCDNVASGFVMFPHLSGC